MGYNAFNGLARPVYEQEESFKKSGVVLLAPSENSGGWEAKKAQDLDSILNPQNLVAIVRIHEDYNKSEAAIRWQRTGPKHLESEHKGMNLISGFSMQMRVEAEGAPEVTWHFTNEYVVGSNTGVKNMLAICETPDGMIVYQYEPNIPMRPVGFIYAHSVSADAVRAATDIKTYDVVKLRQLMLQEHIYPMPFSADPIARFDPTMIHPHAFYADIISGSDATAKKVAEQIERLPWTCAEVGAIAA